jgi:hypothetical protein
MQVGEGVAVGLIPEVSEPSPEKKRVKVRISLFFDGTLNNRENARARDPKARGGAAASPEQSAALKEHGDRGSSYENDFSNVARTEAYMRLDAAGYDHYISIYTEGIGTVDLGGDETRGYALGTGPTGIEAKVNNGITQALTRWRIVANQFGYDTRMTTIEKLSIDTCGFSRGAAAARYCVHCVLLGDDSDPVKLRLEKRGWEVGQVEVLAVGLFDTVSSHGAFLYSNDVADLKLDSITEAKAIFQIAAAEEYRKNFSLTNINCVVKGKGRQVYLPGAHSDIGGGYIENDREDKVLVYGSASDDIAEFLLRRGWYTGDGEDPELRHVVTVTEHGVSQHVSVRRAPILQAYSFIPLHAMAKFLKEQGVPVSGTLDTAYDPGPVPGRAEIEAYANGEGSSKPSDWQGDAPVVDAGVLRELRHRYLHVSFSTKAGMGPRLNNEGSWWRPRYGPLRLEYNG